ncbi:hypothetical protein F5890DRAFT_632700 [Lentinula detonsa]|uniref:Uncharacterized protein n=1 Tax=Lentinula detonsa TaxID=2804962 RepID=A0AA38PT75_9AGAR|nr:hypothetical protein F5890DRAFT_632700 [Lentinula detonsa]
MKASLDMIILCIMLFMSSGHRPGVVSCCYQNFRGHFLPVECRKNGDNSQVHRLHRCGMKWKDFGVSSGFEEI